MLVLVDEKMLKLYMLQVVIVTENAYECSI